jgi:hypothetical protein
MPLEQQSIFINQPITALHGHNYALLGQLLMHLVCARMVIELLLQQEMPPEP